MPALPVSLFDPVREQFAVLMPPQPEVAPSHPLGWHRRVPDRLVFEHVVAALVHGSGYERIASQGCSDRTIRRRLHAWAEAGLATALHTLVLRQYDRMIGLALDDVVVDGCITKAPGGGEHAGRSPVDRGKQGLTRSILTDGAGVPLHVVATGANRHDGPLLGPTLAGLGAFDPAPAGRTVHLDRRYDSGVTRALLTQLGLTGVIAPLQVGQQCVVERTHAWMNGHGKLRRCTERTGAMIAFSLLLAATFVVTRCLILHARTCYRWSDRPSTRRLPRRPYCRSFLMVNTAICRP